MNSSTWIVSTPWAKEHFAKGKAAGKAEARAETVLRIADLRGLGFSCEQRARVTACTDLDQLDRWFDKAVTAASADKIFV